MILRSLAGFAVRPQGEHRARRARSRSARSRSRPPTPPIPSDTIRQQNPLGKIPALILEDGTVLFNSPVILEYLDHRAGGGKIIPQGSRRRASRRCACRRWPTASSMRRSCWSTRAAGGRPRSTSRNGSTTRPARSRARSPRSKPRRPRSTPPPNVGQITLACALGYRDFRFGGTGAKDHPRLVAWLDAFAAQVPAFAATKPPPA